MITFSPVSSNLYSNSTIPETNYPNEFIAAFWDDLMAGATGHVYYKFTNDKFIIQYDKWQHYPGSGSLTFQIILTAGGSIYIYYNTMEDVAGSTVGIEDQWGTSGLQVSYNSNYVTNQKALKFSADPEWLQTNTFDGTIFSGNSVAVELMFSSSNYPYGEYTMDVVINSNDPQNSSVIVPVSMTIEDIVPVELTSFTAEATVSGIEIHWTTATETNNLGFELERSVKEGEWNKIVYIAGKGNSTDISNYAYLDGYKNLQNSGNLKYRLKQIDIDGTINYSHEIEVEGNLTPAAFSLEQNYPNPFNPETKIRFTIPELSKVVLELYNIIGEKLDEPVNADMDAGYYEINWNAGELSSGVYIYIIKAKSKESGVEFSDTKKMLLLK